MHGAQAIAQFAVVVGLIIGILLNTIFVWLALLIAGLRTSFWGRLQLSAAAVIPLRYIPNYFGIFVTIALVMYLVRVVTDADDWTGSLKYIGAQTLISVILILVVLKLGFGTFDINEAMTKLNQKQPAQAYQDGAGGGSRIEEGSTSENSYGLTPEELAEVQRQVNAPLEEFRKR